MKTWSHELENCATLFHMVAISRGWTCQNHPFSPTWDVLARNGFHCLHIVYAAAGKACCGTKWPGPTGLTWAVLALNRIHCRHIVYQSLIPLASKRSHRVQDRIGSKYLKTAAFCHLERELFIVKGSRVLRVANSWLFQFGKVREVTS